MEIRNKTKRPLRVPLPGGTRLFLGPGRTGQVTPKATEFAPLKQLLDDGSLEITRGGPKGMGGAGAGSIGPSAQRGSSGNLRRTGDR